MNDDQISFTAADEPVRLSIEKVDVENQDTKLSGAVFSVTPAGGSTFADGSTDAKILTTGADGTDELVAQLMVGNSYVIEETKAPNGYVAIDGSMTVTVRDDGSIRIADGTTALTEFVVAEDNTVQVFTGTVTNDPTKLTVNKVDATTNQALSGATFTLTGTFADGSTEQTLNVTDGATGSVELDKALLIADGQTQYTLRETVPPAGYERVQQDLTFTVATDGTITPVGTLDGTGWAVGADGISVTAADKPVTIDLVKLGEDTEDQELTGAEFLIKPADGSTFANAADGENESGITVTTDNVSTLLEGKLLVGDTYTLEETHAPDGYEVIPGVLTFTVKDDGTFEKVSGDDAWAISATADGVAVITATDTPIEASLVKVSASGEELPGVAFVLEGTFTDGTMPKTVVGGQDGTAELEGLIAGNEYTLTETVAPEGYEVIAGTLTFTVSKSGELSIVGDAPEGYALSADKVALVAKDTPIEVGIVKVSTEGELLDGATFEVTGRFVGGTEAETRTVGVSAEGAPLEGLVAGETYTVEETVAPAGYDLIEGTWEFTVELDGTLTGDATSADGSVAGYAIADDGVTLRAADAPTPPAPTLPGTYDSTPTFQVALAAGGVALIAAALAYRRLARRRDEER